MTPEHFLERLWHAAVATDFLALRATVGDRPAMLIWPGGNRALDAADPRPLVAWSMDAATLTRPILDEQTKLARALAKSQQGKWTVAGIPVAGGPMSFMPVVVTSAAGDEALEWAGKRHGLGFPVIVDVASLTITRWRHAVFAAADAHRFAKIIERLIRPVLEGAQPRPADG